MAETRGKEHVVMAEAAPDNSDQREFWSGPSGQSWVDHEEEQDAFLADVLLPVAEFAGWSSGDKVVDIGCGTGALSVQAAQAVGEGGHVLATDISTLLLNRAAQRLAPFEQAEALLADAAEATWPRADFDLAVSRFGVMFFANPAKAFANIAEALRPGGRMVFATWAPVTDNPYWSLAHKAAVSHLGSPPKVAPNTPGPFGMADPDVGVERLKAAGLAEVAYHRADVLLRHAGGAEGLADLSVRIGPGKRAINYFDADEKMIDTIRETMVDIFQPFVDEGEARLPAALNLYTAVRP